MLRKDCKNKSAGGRFLSSDEGISREARQNSLSALLTLLAILVMGFLEFLVLTTFSVVKLSN